MGGLKEFVQESVKLAYGEDAQVSCLYVNSHTIPSVYQHP